MENYPYQASNIILRINLLCERMYKFSYEQLGERLQLLYREMYQHTAGFPSPLIANAAFLRLLEDLRPLQHGDTGYEKTSRFEFSQSS